MADITARLMLIVVLATTVATTSLGVIIIISWIFHFNTMSPICNLMWFKREK